MHAWHRGRRRRRTRTGRGLHRNVRSFLLMQMQVIFNSMFVSAVIPLHSLFLTHIVNVLVHCFVLQIHRIAMSSFFPSSSIPSHVPIKIIIIMLPLKRIIDASIDVLVLFLFNYTPLFRILGIQILEMRTRFASGFPHNLRTEHGLLDGSNVLFFPCRRRRFRLCGPCFHVSELIRSQLIRRIGHGAPTTTPANPSCAGTFRCLHTGLCTFFLLTGF